MRRRCFVGLVGGASVAWPFAARTQQSDRLRLIAVLIGLAEDDPDTKKRLAGFRQGLEGLGWSEGRNLQITYRSAAASMDRLQAHAKEVVALQPDIILAQGTAVTAALQRETRTIPIVFVTVSDPIGSGFIASLARPGGNLTGLLMYEGGITGKWLSMLKEIAPRLTRVALLASPSTAYSHFLRAAEAAAPSLGFALVPAPIESAADIERAVETFARVPNGGLLLPPDSLTIIHRNLVIALAARNRLPAVYSLRVFVEAGGLMSYETDTVDIFRRAALYVDRILKGARPADLPAELPTKYATTLNLKTAKALGLTIPDALLVAADEIIE